MACQIFQWLLAGEGPSTLQHGLVGIACLLTYDLFSRWRKRRHPLQMSDARTAKANQTVSYPEQEDQRRAA